jgi:flagellar motor switch protein FliN/FliY
MPKEPANEEPISQEALDALLADMTEKAADPSADPGEIQADQASADSDAEQNPDLTMAGDNDGETAPSSPADAAFDFASFQGISSAQPASGGVFRGFERVQDIPLEITVELGRTKLLIRDILELETGAIIELEKMAGEPVDLLANGLLVARGEVVVIEDNFGVRITEIITQAERKELTDWVDDRRAA